MRLHCQRKMVLTVAAAETAPSAHRRPYCRSGCGRSCAVVAVETYPKGTGAAVAASLAAGALSSSTKLWPALHWISLQNHICAAHADPLLRTRQSQRFYRQEQETAG